MAVVRTGVIGVGHLGYHHARNYTAISGAQLVGVVEPDEGRGAKAATDFGVPRYSDLESLIEAGVDAVSVVTPTTHHCEVVLRLLDAGIDVLVEKPIAATIDQAAAMVAKAAEKGRILQVGHIERFNGAVIALFESGITPKFIECHRLSPFPNRGDDVSVVLDLMIHDLDIVRALDASDVVFVDAVGVPVFSKSEDIANVRIRFASGCVANLTCSRVSMERMRKIRIFSNDAYVSTDYSEQAVVVYRKKPGPLEPGMTPMDLITVESMNVHKDEPLKLELASFVECVRTRNRPLVAGEDGLAALRLAQQVIGSIREHS
ncbi:MAG: Gfo/Idh/MocA family oxidoreductase [Candidatus Hydrogenedentes bacterium]|nr:Gfo/Idh/MocA family oxidoreductase [Candidatus Hydrogenedentota bacterium]